MISGGQPAMAAMTRRAPREFAYCAISAPCGLAGLALIVFWLLPSALASFTVLGTVAGLLCLAGGLGAARFLAALQRRVLSRFAGVTIDAPTRFVERGSGPLVRLERRLKDRDAWRAVGYLVTRLPLTAVQWYVFAFGVFGLLDLLFPLGWLVLGISPSGSPVQLATLLPFGGLAIRTWPGTLLVSLVGAAQLVAAALLARPAVAADAWLARALLGPGSLDRRLRELEQTR